jgi:hypothetical protein
MPGRRVFFSFHYEQDVWRATNVRNAGKVALDTRKAKDYSVEAETLERRWHAEAADVGFGAEQISACFAHDPPEPIDADDVVVLYDALAGPHGLTERAATFTRTDVIETICSAVGVAATAQQIETYVDRFLSSDRALLVDRAVPAGTSTVDRPSVSVSVFVPPSRMRPRDRPQLRPQRTVIDRDRSTRFALRRTMLTRDSAREPFGDPETFLQAAYGSPATLRG